MAFKNYEALALFLSLNLLCSSFATATLPSSYGTCPIDTLQLSVCANLLGLVNVILGTPPTYPCCSIITGVTDLEAAVCLCTAIKAGVLGVVVDVDVKISLLLNLCGKKIPTDFLCT